MPFEQWAEKYFGKDVVYPQVCRDAWLAATLVEREACALLAEEVVTMEGYEKEIAESIRARSP